MKFKRKNSQNIIIIMVAPLLPRFNPGNAFPLSFNGGPLLASDSKHAVFGSLGLLGLFLYWMHFNDRRYIDIQ